MWVLAVLLLLAVLVHLLGHKAHRTTNENDGILYRVFQRVGGGQPKKPE